MSARRIVFWNCAVSRFSISRRRAMSLAIGGIVLAPFALAGRARAAQNAQMRAALKYQDTPMKDQQCSTCAHFIPGKSPQDRGACQIIPGDTEISPRGWCTAWVAAPKK